MAHAEVFSSLNLQTGSCPWTDAEFYVQADWFPRLIDSEEFDRKSDPS